MDSSFDYNSPSVPDTAVADVVADIISAGKLPPLSDAEKEQRRIDREIYRWECQQRDEQRRIEYEERQAEAEAVARAEQAAEIAEANRKARLERQEQIARQVREREMADLQFKVRSHQVWQNHVDAAARIAVHQRQHQTLMGELEKMLSPPAPPPEPEPVDVADDDLGSPNIGDPDFNPGYWLHKPIFRR
jgi:hypothetical protein